MSEYISLDDHYRVDLEAFEGPLDLLLHLVREEKVDIGNIPIAKVLDQYLSYIELMEELNIDLSGEFILMASELAWIKSRMCLPIEELSEDATDTGQDPRAELIRRLLEYQRYKEAAQTIAKRPMLNRDVFLQGVDQVPELDDAPMEVDLSNLVTLFSQILAKAPKRLSHEVMPSSMSVTERIYEIVDFFKTRGHNSLVFQELFSSEHTRSMLIISFLAVLEMCKLKLLRIHQVDKNIFLTVQNDELSEVNSEEINYH